MHGESASYGKVSLTVLRPFIMQLPYNASSLKQKLADGGIAAVKNSFLAMRLDWLRRVEVKSSRRTGHRRFGALCSYA